MPRSSVTANWSTRGTTRSVRQVATRRAPASVRAYESRSSEPRAPSSWRTTATPSATHRQTPPGPDPDPDPETEPETETATAGGAGENRQGRWCGAVSLRSHMEPTGGG